MTSLRNGFCSYEHFGRDAFKSLLFRVVSLSDRAVELVTSRSVVALEFIIDMRGRAEFLFKTICPYERRRTVHFVKVADLVGDREKRRSVVNFLLYEVAAEHGVELGLGSGLAGGGVKKGRGLNLHIRADVVPLLRHFVFVKINFVRDFFVFGFHNRNAPFNSMFALLSV